MVARKPRDVPEIPAAARAFGEDRSTWGYVPSGIPVYAVIDDLKAYDGNVDLLLREAGGALTREDVESAVGYYEAHRQEIDHKLDQIANW